MGIETIEAILQETTIGENNQKVFGIFDDQISHGQMEVETKLGSDKADLSICMPAFYRTDRLAIALEFMIAGLNSSGLQAELLLVDNAFHQDDELSTGVISKLRNGPFTRFVYTHAPRLNYPGIRNTAYEQMESPIFVSWDSDIYIANAALGLLVKQLQELAAVAPPLASFLGYKEAITQHFHRYSSLRSSIKLRNELIMPGKIGEEIGIFDEERNILRTAMIRGLFLARKGMLDNIAALNPDNTPFLRDFSWWSNVPFSLSAREMGFDIGYLLDGSVIALHDENPDAVSMTGGNAWEQIRKVELLKALTLLFYRNQIFTPHEQKRNSLFMNFNNGTLKREFNLDNIEQAAGLQQVLIAIAGSLNSGCAIDITELEFSLEVTHALESVLMKLFNPRVLERVRGIKRFKEGRFIYQVD